MEIYKDLSKPVIKEFENLLNSQLSKVKIVEGELISEFIKNGARYTAYPPIVGSGPNTCILHYTNNSDEIADGDLLLIDSKKTFSQIILIFPAPIISIKSFGLVFSSISFSNS